MPCYHPLKAFTKPCKPGEKRIIAFASSAEQTHAYKDGHFLSEPMLIPCGQCIGCRLEYSRQWAMRCVLEAKEHEHNYFVTLTYDDEFVPLNEHFTVDRETGEVVSSENVMSLLPDDLKGFIKRLRSRFRDTFNFTGIRFFACGEYGPLNMRPHYHLILFNCPLNDLAYDYSANGYTYYRSQLLEEVWKKGFVLVTDFSFDTAAYVARYMLKKHKGFDSDYYEKHGIYPEFTRSSRRPGISKVYLDKNVDKIYTFDSIVVPGGYGKVLECKPPRYYDRLFDDIDPVRLSEIKSARQAVASGKMSLQLSRTDKNEDEYLQVKENNKMLSIKSLVRNL